MDSEPFITKVIASRRITIPKRIAEKLELSEGDFIEVKILRKITNSEVSED